MILAIEKSPAFHLDVTNQFSWYFNVAGDRLAWRFFDAVDLTLLKLAGQPGLGAICRFQNPILQDLRSHRLESPFHKFLIFYRASERTLRAFRLMHGARDLPNRLTEQPN